jgi:hypothetical protein
MVIAGYLISTNFFVILTTSGPKPTVLAADDLKNVFYKRMKYT